MKKLKPIHRVLVVLCIILSLQAISFTLSVSRFLDFSHILIQPVWIYSKSVLWTIWIVKTALITFCITKVYPYKPSKQRSRIFKLWAIYFILDIIWPLVFLWIGSPLASAIIVTCMLPILYLALLSTLLLDKLAGYALIIFSLIILSKAFLHWTIYWLDIRAL